MITEDTQLGFVGLGKMGVPMVRRLIGAGFTVHGANRSPETVTQLSSEGMSPASSVAELTTRADVIMTALPDEPSVRLVSREIRENARSGQVWIEHSTISPGLAREMSTLMSDVGVGYLDAPVSGGPAGAEAGKLTVMAGGDAGLLEDMRPVLSAFGNPIRHCGEVGAGQAIKLVNQLLVAIHTSAAAEAAAFGAKMGIHFDVIGEVIGTSFGSSAMLARNLPRFAADDYSAATPVSLIKKDLSLIQAQADQLGTDLRLGDVAQELFSDAVAQGWADNDMAALYRLWSNGA